MEGSTGSYGNKQPEKTAHDYCAGRGLNRTLIPSSGAKPEKGCSTERLYNAEPGSIHYMHSTFVHTKMSILLSTEWPNTTPKRAHI